LFGVGFLWNVSSLYVISWCEPPRDFMFT